MKRGIRPGLPRLYKSAFAPLPHFINLTATTDTASYQVSLQNPLVNPESAWRFGHEFIRNGDQIVAGRTLDKGTLQIQTVESPPLTLDPHEAITALAGITAAVPAVSALLAALRSYAIYTPFTPMLRGTTLDPGQRDPVGLAGGRLAEAVLGALAACSAACRTCERGDANAPHRLRLRG